MTDRRHRRPLPLGGEDGLPFSKGLLARTLTGTGISTDRAYELAVAAEADIAQSGRESITFERLGELARETLGKEEGERAVGRLQRLADLQRLDVPIIVLIGGSTGTGKSTVAAEVAHRLGITRVTSTDVVRQTMRAFFSAEFMPSIHYSSFEVGKAVSRVEGDKRDPNLTGFLDQTRNVLVGVHAVLGRALEEGYSLALEGVHIVPGMVRPPDGALVCQVLLAIEDEEDHESHFWTRDAASEGLRPFEKYLRALPDIRRIQDYLVKEAAKAGVPVIENSRVEETVDQVIALVLDQIERELEPA